MGLSELGNATIITREVAKAVTLHKPTKNVLYNALITTVIFSLFLIILVLLLTNVITTNLFNEPGLKYVLYLLVTILPITAMTSIFKGYFNGLERMDISSVSTLIEQIIRFILSILLTSYFVKKSILLAVIAYFFCHVLGELFSLLFIITKWLFCCYYSRIFF